MIKPVLQLGHVAILVDDDRTVVFDLRTGEEMFYLNKAEEYVLTKMLVEKSVEWDPYDRACGEILLRNQVMPATRQLVLM